MTTTTSEYACLDCGEEFTAAEAMNDHIDESHNEGYGSFGDECILHLDNGNTLRTDTFEDSPDGASYVRVCDPDGREFAYWTWEEWAEDPMLVMGAIFGAAANAPDDLLGDDT